MLHEMWTVEEPKSQFCLDFPSDLSDVAEGPAGGADTRNEHNTVKAELFKHLFVVSYFSVSDEPCC